MAQPRTAAVVGSGPNGLSAALLLAEAGYATTVFERNAAIGGAARSGELTQPGFVHDFGSAVHPLGVGSPFFSSLPLQSHGLHWIHPAAPLAHPLDDGSAVLVGRSVEETAAGLGADAGAYRKLIGRLVRDWNALVAEALAPPMHVPHHWSLALRLARRVRRGVRSVVARFGTDRARALFAGIGAHANVPLDHVASGAVGLMLLTAAHAVGWPIPEGGAGSITRALGELLRERGGTILTNSPIQSIAQLDWAELCMLDVTPAQLVELGQGRLPAGYRSRLSRYRYGPGVFKMDWALSDPIPWRAPACSYAGTVHVGGTLEEIAASERAAWNGERCDRPFVLVSQPTLFDPSRAPPGCHIAWAYCHVPSRSTEDATGTIEAQIERFAPGFLDTVLARSAHGPADLEADNPNLVGGDIGGGAMSAPQFPFRPMLALDPYVTPLRGMYLCSSSTPPGPGVHGLCGMYAARTALDRQRGP